MSKLCGDSDVPATIWHPTSSRHTTMSVMTTRTEWNSRMNIWLMHHNDDELKIHRYRRTTVRCIDIVDEVNMNEWRELKRKRDRSQSNQFNSSMRWGHRREDGRRSGVMAFGMKCIVRRWDRLHTVIDEDGSDTSTWVMDASGTENWRKSLNAHGSVDQRWDRPSSSRCYKNPSRNWIDLSLETSFWNEFTEQLIRFSSHRCWRTQVSRRDHWREVHQAISVSDRPSGHFSETLHYLLTVWHSLSVRSIA